MTEQNLIELGFIKNEVFQYSFNNNYTDYYFELNIKNGYGFLSCMETETKKNNWTVYINDTEIFFNDYKDLKNHIEYIIKHIEK